MKIIVTGGAGFIGSHLVDLLLAEGNEVCVIDNFSYGKRSYLNTANPLLQIRTGDITDKNFITQSITAFNPEVIFHLAALHHIPTCESTPDIALKINVEGTQHILNAAANTDSVKKIVFASSGAVYDIVEEPLEEDKTATVPYDVYSVSKLSGEYLLRLWANKYNKKARVARIFNTIGGRETNAHLIPEIIEQILDGKTTIQLGNLDPKRSYIDTRDTSAGILALSKIDSDKPFEVVNVGREDEFDVKEIVDMIGEASKIKLTIEQSPARIRKVDRKKQLASMNKMLRLSGWAPQYSVKEGIQYAFDFGQKNRHINE